MTSPPTASLATAQRSLGDPGRRYPLWPPLTGGCPATSTEEVPVEARWPLTRRIAYHFGLHPVSNLTPQAHTGHAFGAEGYKTVAYELHAELGVPAAVFVPTGYGELLFGIHKGFAELRRLGVTDRVPRLIACEPATGGPLTAALRQGLPATWVEVGPTEAYGINCPVGGYRGVVAVRESGGRSVLVTDEQARAAQAELGRAGLWAELSAAVGLAGLRAAPREEFDGPVVCVSTSAGFKDQGAGRGPREAPVAEWEAARARLLAAGLRE
ncbi:pyridoxal-phosphate dependent enzyme [Streptomyces albidoflavus]